MARAAREDALVRGLLSGIDAFRWLAWAWLAVILALSRPEFSDPRTRPWVAGALAGAALAVTAGATVLRRSGTDVLLSRPVVAAEVAVGALLMVGDPLAYNGVGHPQGLGSAWPLAGILTAGVAFGRTGGLAAGLAVGTGRIAANVFDPAFAWDDRAALVSTVSTLVLYALAGGTAGFVMVRLREAERRIGLAQAREEVSRTLHDGVLQTLAVVQRRSGDADVTRLARDQERELRQFLFGGTDGDGDGDLGARLRTTAARFEDRFGGTARIVLAPDLPDLRPATIDALAGTVTEALTNAGKHGRAQTATVYAEPAGDGTVFCSIKDDGTGFDPATMPEGAGLRLSVRGRIAQIGGRVEIDGRPGRGAEIRCWVPT